MVNFRGRSNFVYCPGFWTQMECGSLSKPQINVFENGVVIAEGPAEECRSFVRTMKQIYGFHKIQGGEIIWRMEQLKEGQRGQFGDRLGDLLKHVNVG